MNQEAHHKVQAEHLSRNAYLYVRQSTLRQVRENLESSQRQYGRQCCKDLTSLKAVLLR